MPFYQQLLIACPLVFFAGLVDSIAGGGAMISLPAYHLVGLPPHFALGTNKMSSCIGTVFSSATYLKSGYVLKRIAPVSVVFALFGSWLGARSALLLDEQILRWVMVILVPLLIAFTLLKKDLFTPEPRELSAIKEQSAVALISLIIGFYDGFFGPGTGMFLMLAFVTFLRLNPITASGNAKVVNLCSNIAALATFIVGGKVFYALAIPCAFFSVLGNIIGSKLAIKKGAGLIRKCMLGVVILLLATVLKDLLLNS